MLPLPSTSSPDVTLPPRPPRYVENTMEVPSDFIRTIAAVPGGGTSAFVLGLEGFDRGEIERRSPKGDVEVSFRTKRQMVGLVVPFSAQEGREEQFRTIGIDLRDKAVPSPFRLGLQRIFHWKLQ